MPGYVWCTKGGTRTTHHFNRNMLFRFEVHTVIYLNCIYYVTVVTWGDKNLVDSAAACCESCSSTKGCNVWVYCPNEGGCGGGEKPRPHKECWLKNADIQELLENVVGKGHSGTSWRATWEKASREGLVLYLMYLDFFIKI